ncbi:MAG: metal-dependent transcriptional regulator [Gemmatimonadaceae bacterium]|nr:metal-dependent transcriptional regulator [Gemmatimonadaceae bacterium]
MSARTSPASAQSAAAPPFLTEPVEDYLKAIYELETRTGAAATTDVANALQVAPASVTGMIRRLAAQGLLDHVPYRGVQLTEMGRRAALRTIRRHRILETYLTQVLGYAWDRVHDEAERLEHAASDDLIERMSAALGHPTVDPHGAPIPTADGTVDERNHRTIADLTVGETVRMLRVSDKDPELLRYLAEIAMQPGVSITLLQRAPFDGPLTLRVGSGEQVVGSTLAAQVLVESLPVPEASASDAGSPSTRPRSARKSSR